MSTSHVRAEEGVCASIRLEIQQRMVITRTAFRATMTLSNGTDSDFVEEVEVTLDIRDEFGEPALELFNTDTLELTGIDDVSGNGIVPPNSEASASWLIKPRRLAAPTEATLYDIGGTLSYRQGESHIVIPLYPERVTVLPDPRLDVRYFWQRDVFSDDPFSDVIEPAVPFSLVLMVSNHGYGEARNMHITSSQPRITANDRDLLIAFQLLGTSVNGQPVTPNLAVNFGDVLPGTTAIAEFLMTSSLEGHFYNYEVSYEHVTGLGDPQLSVIDNVSVYELIHTVYADRPTRPDDGLPDMLVNRHTWYDMACPQENEDPCTWIDPPDPHEVPDTPEEDPEDIDRVDLPDTVYFSDGTEAFVTPVLVPEANVSVQVDAQDPTLVVTANMPGGWAYVKAPDLFEGAYTIAQVERADGTTLNAGHNAWQSDRVFIRGGSQVERNWHRLHIFDYSNPGMREYTVRFNPDSTAPRALKWASIHAHGEGSLAEVPLEIWNDESFVEPRAGGVQHLRIWFDKPIAPDSFGLVSIHGRAADDEAIEIPSESITMFLDDTGRVGNIVFSEPRPTVAKYCVELVGVQDLPGHQLAAGGRRIITVLPGDVDGNPSGASAESTFFDVDNIDVGIVGDLVGTDPIVPSTMLHARCDINCDGHIDMTDVSLAAQHRGTYVSVNLDPCPLTYGPDEWYRPRQLPTLNRPVASDQ